VYREPAAPTRPCPRCRVGLVARPVGDVTLEECTSCNGLFVGAGILDRLLDAQDLGLEVIATFPAGQPAAQMGPLYIACPTCGKLMNRRLFAVGSQVIVDECKTHGTWFDEAELRTLAEFAHAGGLERERRRQEKERERERARAFPAAHVPDTSVTAEGALWRALLDFLRRRLG
jgi:Zn-finger nucleic acid-binding protein